MAKRSSDSCACGFFVAALGCPKNLVEAEVITGTMLSAGYSLCFTPDEADLYIVDTCAFLPAARSEAAAEISEASAWKMEMPEQRRIVVAGCLLNHADLPEFRTHFAEVDYWLPVDFTDRLPEVLSGAVKLPEPDGSAVFLADERHPRFQLTLPHVAYLKISDGCDNRCSYCAIPGLRGALRSRTAASVVAEAKMLIGNGVKELIIIAQDITAFGSDRPERGEDLAGLLRQLDALPGDFRMRLLYTHPAHYTDELIEVIAGAKKILPYLDMPLQHISDRILKAMNRHIDRAGIETLLEKLHRKIPGLILRSTFITGLPGESEAEFEELCAFVRKWKFDRFGVFSYAPEPGTPAAAMGDQVPVEIADMRAEKLLSRQIRRMKSAQKKLIGSTLTVLVDTVEPDGVAVARGAADAPEIDNVIYFAAGRNVRPGMSVEVTVTGVSKCDLIGEMKKYRKHNCR